MDPMLRPALGQDRTAALDDATRVQNDENSAIDERPEAEWRPDRLHKAKEINAMGCSKKLDTRVPYARCNDQRAD